MATENNSDAIANASHNMEGNKLFVFSQTGNIMISTTYSGSKADATIATMIPKDVENIFEEVSVFYAAMTKAISSSINPLTKLPYTLYDYDAYDGVLSGSGLFTAVFREDQVINTQHYDASADVPSSIVQSIIGLATGTAVLPFAKAMITSMNDSGTHLKASISADNTSKESKLANIIFVCENLYGATNITATLISVDAKQFTTKFKANTCGIKTGGGSVHTELTVHKETFLFTPPSWIATKSKDLLMAMNDPNMNLLCSALSNSMSKTPMVQSIVALNNGAQKEVPAGQLEYDTQYVAVGQHLDAKTAVDSFLEDKEKNPNKEAKAVAYITLSLTNTQDPESKKIPMITAPMAPFSFMFTIPSNHQDANEGSRWALVFEGFVCLYTDVEHIHLSGLPVQNDETIIQTFPLVSPRSYYFVDAAEVEGGSDGGG